MKNVKYDKNKYPIFFGSECALVEKYYCEKCRLLYNDVEVCKVCGSIANNKIKIEVQTQSEK